MTEISYGASEAVLCWMESAPCADGVLDAYAEAEQAGLSEDDCVGHAAEAAMSAVVTSWDELSNRLSFGALSAECIDWVYVARGILFPPVPKGGWA